MVQPTCLDRARGALLGSAVGDALGAPLEGLSTYQIRAHYGQVVDFVDGALAWRRKPYRLRLPGLYSDDTQQTLAVADVLLSCGRIDPRRLAELYLELAEMAEPPGAFLGAYRGVGRSFREAILALRRGDPATAQSSAGAGAAVRVAPVAIYFAGKPEAMVEAVLDASLITHRDCRALAGALAVAHAVRRLAAGAAREPSFLLRLAGEVAAGEAHLARRANRVCGVKPFGTSLARAIAHVESILDAPRPRALAALVEEANRHGPSNPCRRPTMGFAPACIPTCLYLLMTTDSFEEALIEAVNLGGDADNAGAILGAMAGAHYGIGAIPERWLHGLHNRPGIDLRAEALSRRSTDGLAIPDLVATERHLSELEAARSREVIARQDQGNDGLGVNRRS
jgi:ADP-ribosylglycohydrolase